MSNAVRVVDRVRDLSDVNFTSNDGAFLVYDETAGKFVQPDVIKREDDGSLTVNYAGDGDVAINVSGGMFHMSGGKACFETTGALIIVGTGVHHDPDFEHIKLHWDEDSETYQIITEAGGTGVVRDIGIVGAKLAVGSQVPTASLDVTAGTTSVASIRVRTGVAPTVPNEGDVYGDGTNLYYRRGDGTWASLDNPAGGSSGQIQFNSSGVFGGASGFTYQSATSPNVTIQAQNAAHVPLLVKGAASQTANLQEWQDSAGTMLAKITSEGLLFFGTLSPTPPFASTKLFVHDNTSNAIVMGWRCADAPGTVSSLTTFGDGNAYLASIDFVTVSAGTAGADVLVKTATGYSLVERLRVSSGTQTVLITTAAASSVGLTVKGAASQSANLQEWQDSAGTVLSKIDSSGSLVFEGGGCVFTYASSGISNVCGGSFNGYTLQANSGNTLRLYGRSTRINNDFNGSVVCYIEASSGQSVPIFQLKGTSSTQVREQVDLDTAWADSTDATRKARFIGRVWDTSAREFIRAESDGTNALVGIGGSTTALTALTVQAPTSGIAGVFKAAATTPGNIAEFQNSGGTVLGSFASNGLISLVPTANAGTLFSLVRSGGDNFQQFLIQHENAATNSIYLRLNALPASVPICLIANRTLEEGVFSYNRPPASALSVSGTELVVKSTSIESRIISSSTLYTPLTLAINTQAALITSPTSTVKGLVVKGAASQSANLQEWQNSSGTPLVAIGPTGLVGIGTTPQSGYSLYVRGDSFSNSSVFFYLNEATGRQHASLYCEAAATNGVVLELKTLSTHKVFVWADQVNSRSGIGHSRSVSAGNTLGSEIELKDTTITQKFGTGSAVVSSGQFDTNSTAGNTRFLLYDVDTATLQRVKVGANGTGPSGTGRALYIDNA